MFRDFIFNGYRLALSDKDVCDLNTDISAKKVIYIIHFRIMCFVSIVGSR